jgi:hypothetical protein
MGCDVFLTKGFRHIENGRLFFAKGKIHDALSCFLTSFEMLRENVSRVFQGLKTVLK